MQYTDDAVAQFEARVISLLLPLSRLCVGIAADSTGDLFYNTVPFAGALSEVRYLME